VDVEPPRRARLELLAQLAHEHVHRPVAVRHRVAPHALVDLLAGEHLPACLSEELYELVLAAREVEALTADERLELVGPYLELTRLERPSLDRRARALAPPYHRLDSSDHLLGMGRLVDPVIGAEPQPADALRDRRLRRANDQPEAGYAVADPLDVVPRGRPEE
jgi:hypothetical protein